MHLRYTAQAGIFQIRRPLMEAGSLTHNGEGNCLKARELISLGIGHMIPIERRQGRWSKMSSAGTCWAEIAECSH